MLKEMLKSSHYNLWLSPKRVKSTLLSTMVGLFILFSATSQAVTVVNYEESRQAARAWLETQLKETGKWGSSDKATIKRSVKLFSDAEQKNIIAYLHEVSPTGFIIVPAIKEMPPLTCYSMKNKFEYKSIFSKFLTKRLNSNINR